MKRPTSNTIETTNIDIPQKKFSSADYEYLLKENEALKKRLKKFTIIQQNLIKANDTIDKQLEVYKRFNFYNKKIVETQNIQDFKTIIPEAVIDCFNVDSAMVVFDSPDRKAIYTEGFGDSEDSNHYFECVKKFLKNYHQRKPVYFYEEHLTECIELADYSNMLCRKFDVPNDHYCFYIIGFVSRKYSNHVEPILNDDLVVFDNFSEQMHSILRHRLASKNLETAKEKYRSIIANMRLGLLEVDNDERILMTNQCFTEMSGYTEEELKGQIASELLLGADARVHMKNKNRERLECKASVYEADIVNKAGEKRTWLISGAPNYDLEGNVNGSIGIHLDITNQKLVEHRLSVANNDLKKINAELDTFVYRVSHDLRTPLVSITSLTNLIKAAGKEQLGDQNMEMIELIAKSANRLDESIKEILNYSRNSRLEITPSSFSLTELLDDIIEDIKFANQQIQFEITCNGLEIVHTDKLRLATILKNLVSNAVKYHDASKAHNYVGVFIKATTDHYEITVKDNGIGMSLETKNKIFDMFYRGTSKSQGTGLGMFIVREIVDKLNGQIKVESTLGSGTTFYIKLPVLKGYTD